MSKLQDEICNDVIYTIVNSIILDEDDDGISSMGMEALGRFLRHGGKMNENDLCKEICHLKCDMGGMAKCHHLLPMKHMWDGEGGPYGCGGYANSTQDVDYMAQQSDVQWRILKNVIGPPRVRKLFTRVGLYKKRQHQIRCMTVLNDIMIFVYLTERERRGAKGAASAAADGNTGTGKSSVNLGKDGFAKRWYEFDSTMLIQEYVELFLIPLLRSCSAEEGDIGVVMNALMLCSAVKCKENWYDQLIRLSVQKLQQGLIQTFIQGKSVGGKKEKINLYKNQTTAEMTLNRIATLLIAIRGIQRMDRVQMLILIAHIISNHVPSTHEISNGSSNTISPAIQFQDGSRRMPSRIGYWADIAFALLLPDGVSNHDESILALMSMATSPTNVNIPSSKTGKQSSWNAIKYFLTSDMIQSILSSRNSSSISNTVVMHPAEEMVYTLCSVAYTIGKRISPTVVSIENHTNGGTNVNDDSSHVMIDVTSHQPSIYDNIDGMSSSLWIISEYESWLRASLEILNSFLPCFGWNLSSSPKHSNSDRNRLETESSFSFACQRSYIELLKVVLIASGMLSTNSSVFLHFCCSIPCIPDDTKPDDVKPFLQSNNITTENELMIVLDNLLKLLSAPTSQKEIKLCRRQRISLLALLSDAWVQRSKGIMNSNGGLLLDQKEIAGPVDVDEDVANINEQQARQLLSQLAMEISILLDEESNGSSSDGGEAQRSLLACIASVETIGYTSQLLVNHFSESKTNAENEESARHIVSVCTVVLKGQGKVEVEGDDDEIEIFSDQDSTSIASQTIASSTDSVPPRSKSRVTSFTKECSVAAKRLQNFVGYYDNEFDFDKKGQKFIDFHCLCPLFKRANFGLNKNDKNNDLWLLGDRLSLIHANNDLDDALFREPPTQISEGVLFNMQRVFSGETYYVAYFLQLYRQLLCQRVEQAIESSPLHFLQDPISSANQTSSKAFPYRIFDPLRLGTPPLSKERFPSGRMMNEEKLSFSNNVNTISSSSDPLAVTLSYSVQQLPRFDGDVEWALVVTVIVYNVTAVPIRNGVRMDASISQKGNEPHSDETTLEYPFESNKVMMTETSLYKNELEPGGHFIWEFILDSWPSGGELCITSTLRGLEVETSTFELLDMHDYSEEKEVSDYEDKTVDKIEGGNEEREETADVVFPGAPVSIPSMIILQPSPLVFYRDRLGDQNTFQFLWFSMPYCLPDFKLDLINPNTEIEHSRDSHSACRILASSSCLNILCDKNNEKQEVSAWAFLTWSGKHILAMANSNIDSDNSKMNISVKGDDQQMLDACVVSQKQIFISKLTGGKWSIV